MLGLSGTATHSIPDMKRFKEHVANSADVRWPNSPEVEAGVAAGARGLCEVLGRGNSME